jgi:lipoprotein-anchoring transpeptidase ErfK/SrfK
MTRASRFLALFALVPAVLALIAAASTPGSANALPSFELATTHGPQRITAAQLGATRTNGHLHIDGTRLRAAVARLGAGFARAPTAGDYALVGGRVVIKPGSPGIALDTKRAETLFFRALHGTRTSLELPLRVVAALPAPAHAIVVNLETFRLDFYAGPKLVEHFAVGVGQLSFPTPPGEYHIVAKELHPAWTNPGSSWARGMPHHIPPGPYNPLGTRALALDRGALLIHGTPQPWTVGHRASHGCIRLKRADIEHLYDMTEVGTPVFIIP